jgi:type IX secretion system PorP/SprF family membrane protein
MVMRLKKIFIIIIFFSFFCVSEGQDTWYGNMSGMRSMLNPGFSGVEGKNSLRLSSCSFLPGRGFDLTSLFASFDGYIPSLHGGASVWVDDDIMGDVTNEIQAGVAYAYHLKAGDNLFFTAGLTFSFIHLGINRSAIVLPDDIDPFYGVITPSGELINTNGITRFDIGTGITLSAGDWYGGVSVMHLSQPYMSDNQEKNSRIPRKYLFEGGTTIVFGEHMMLQPVLTIIFQGEGFIGSAGTCLKWKQVSAGLSGWYIKDGFAALQPVIGWSNGSTSISMSYGYNLDLPDNTLPSTAMVKASLSINLKDVEKRRVFHIIKLPEM